MKYRQLGATGMRVSEVGLGCEHLQGKPRDRVLEVVDAALEAGMNLLDVFMCEPNVRTDIGLALEGRRERAIVQGHVGSCWVDGQYARKRELDVCRANFDDLLARLKTDYIDIGMIHFIDDLAEWDAFSNSPTMDYVRSLRASGVIRAVGLSSHSPQVALRAVESGLIEVLMFSLNPAYDLMPADLDLMDLFEGRADNPFGDFRLDPSRAALYRACEARGVGVTVMKGVAAGALLSDERSPFGKALSVHQCINYALTRPAVASVALGMQTVSEVREAARYSDLPDAERDCATALAGMRKYSLDGRCMYCNHCLPCPAGIDIAQVNKFLDLVELDRKPAGSVRAHYLELGATAGDCLSCGDCEVRCPFGVRVRERMAAAEAVFGA